MVAPAFGFSVGDFIAGTKLLITLLSAFKERGGASTKYASESSFLTSLVSTLQHLDNYVKNITQDDISRDITKLLKTMEGPLDEFKLFLDKYEASLGQTSTKTALGKTKAMITYTVKDISGKVEKLRRQVEQPLEAVNSLLSMSGGNYPTDLLLQKIHRKAARTASAAGPVGTNYRGHQNRGHSH